MPPREGSLRLESSNWLTSCFCFPSLSFVKERERREEAMTQATTAALMSFFYSEKMLLWPTHMNKLTMWSEENSSSSETIKYTNSWLRHGTQTDITTKWANKYGHRCKKKLACISFWSSCHHHHHEQQWRFDICTNEQLVPIIQLFSLKSCT